MSRGWPPEYSCLFRTWLPAVRALVALPATGRGGLLLLLLLLRTVRGFRQTTQVERRLLQRQRSSSDSLCRLVIKGFKRNCFERMLVSCILDTCATSGSAPSLVPCAAAARTGKSKRVEEDVLRQIMTAMAMASHGVGRKGEIGLHGSLYMSTACSYSYYSYSSHGSFLACPGSILLTPRLLSHPPYV
jgi:hypothetical protein